MLVIYILTLCLVCGQMLQHDLMGIWQDDAFADLQHGDLRGALFHVNLILWQADHQAF